jgi:subtilisin family serine protease
VIVAVIDSGVALSHPEFGAGTQWWVNDDEIADNGMDDDGNGYIDDRYGWDFVDDDPNPLDENGHGTQMASLIAASQDDGEAIAGIAPHARIMALRVFENTGGATTASILAALEYAGQNGAQLVTLSMGRDGFSEAEAAQFEALDALGVLCVIAAGNGGADGESDDNDVTPTYPASYASENIISVAATDESDELASFSNFGLVSVDLAAPGENILGADVTRELFSQETFDSGTLGWSYDCDGTCTNQNTWQYIFPGIPGINNWATDSYTQAGFFFDDWDYLPDTVVDFNSPALPMPVAGAGLEFRIWQQLAAGDSLLAEGSGDGGTTWSLLPGLPPFVEGGSELPTPNESPTTGSVVSADLSEFDALPSAKLRFRLVSDGEAEATGIFIDDVTITQVAALDPENPNYAFVSGTSSSATIVSGIAALVMSERPDLTHREVREVVLSSVDTLPSLAGKVATGGRVNARAAVAAAQAFPAPEPSTVAMAIAALVSLAGLRTARRRAH